MDLARPRRTERNRHGWKVWLFEEAAQTRVTLDVSPKLRDKRIGGTEDKQSGAVLKRVYGYAIILLILGCFFPIALLLLLILLHLPLRFAGIWGWLLGHFFRIAKVS